MPRARKAVQWSACQPWSDLRRQLADEIGMRLRIDLALEKLRSGTDGDLRHVLAQRFARAGGLEIDLLLGGCDQSLAFLRGSALGLLDEVIGAMLRLVD